MDVAGLSHEHGAGSSATHRSADTGERRGRRSHTGAVRAESARPGQGPSGPAGPIERAADALAAAPDTADQLQADYFVRLLVGRRGLIDQRIEEHQRRIAATEANGDIDAAAGLRQLVCIAEQDRQTVEALIEKLCRRFARRVPGEAPTASPRGRLAASRSGPGAA